MDNWDTAQLVAADKRYVWDPFTSMGDWCASDQEPIVLVGGEGAIVRNSRGREYIDGNSSIWTNVHGHNHPRLNAAKQTLMALKQSVKDVVMHKTVRLQTSSATS
jgi:adenosylmethionine---8-amino-7-oxononanoate aminotransferase